MTIQNKVWPKAIPHRSLGHRPRRNVDQERLAEGHTHARRSLGDYRRVRYDDEYGLRPKDGGLNQIPGALPQATVTRGRWPSMPELFVSAS
jgi:hypothetical protein